MEEEREHSLEDEGEGEEEEDSKESKPGAGAGERKRKGWTWREKEKGGGRKSGKEKSWLGHSCNPRNRSVVTPAGIRGRMSEVRCPVPRPMYLDQVREKGG